MAPFADPGLRDSIDKVDEQKRKVVTEFDNLTARANETLSRLDTAKWIGTAAFGLGGYLLADHYVDKVRSLFDRLRHLVEQVLAKVQEILDKATPVLSLVTRAFDWVDHVQAPVSGLSDRAATYTLHANEWSGLARKVYDQRVPRQVGAIGALGTAAADIGTWLMDLAKENAAYILSLLDPLEHIVSALIAAAIDAGSVAGILEAIGKGAELVQNAVDDMWAALKQAVDHALTVVSKKLDAHKVLADVGDGWPQMVNV